MSVNGKVIPHTPVAVDFWQVRKCPGTRLFFLSHMHSDHTVGLTDTWSDRPIYCSQVTANLLRLKIQVKEQWIHPLELGEPYSLSLDDIGKEKLTVTLIEANHCPGAVMFLFEAYFGSILYTGDFRYTPSMLREPCLRTNATIDVLYLDNTNCDPNRTLPSRQRATQQIKEIIRSHPNHSVVIGLYALGKESLLCELAMEFKTWIEVSFERMQTLTVLEMPDVFTTDPGAGRIRVVDQSAICSTSLHQWNKERPTLAILPTSRPLVSYHPNLHVVPYSDHSSYQELEDFVSALKPSCLIPIVGNYLPGSISALLPSKKRHEFLVPESVRHYMMRKPESPHSSSAYTSLNRRYVRPLGPRGVIFDSPVSGSRKSMEDTWLTACLDEDGSEEELDAEGSAIDSDCILSDLSKDLIPTKRQRASDMWSLNSVMTASVESVALDQFTQCNFAQFETPTRGKACLKPVGNKRRSFEINGQKINDMASNDNYSSQHSRRHTSSDRDSVSQHTRNGIDQDDCIILDGNSTSSSDQHASDWNDSETLTGRSLCNDSFPSSRSLSKPRQESVEEIESSILKDLPFTEEDLQTGVLLDKSFVQRIRLCPLYEAKKKMGQTTNVI